MSLNIKTVLFILGVATALTVAGFVYFNKFYREYKIKQAVIEFLQEVTKYDLQK